MKTIFLIRPGKVRLSLYDIKWFNRKAKFIKRGISWTGTFYADDDIENYMVYEFEERDYTLVYWLVECQIINGNGKAQTTNKVKFIPHYQVEIISHDKTTPIYLNIKPKEK